MFALFESLGGIELVVVGIGALLLFGKDLPKVAADAGAQFTKFKRSLDATWRESGLEREMRQIRDALPRDLSLTDVARTASEKLSVRLEEEERARQADATGAGPVARGATAPEPAPPAPTPHVVVPVENVAVEPVAAGIDPASEFRGSSARPISPRPGSVAAPSAGPDEAPTAGASETDEPLPPSSVRA